MGESNDTQSDAKDSIFPRTDWSELRQTVETDTERLDRLIRTYWAPLKIYLTATFPSLRDQAETLLQEFAEDKVMKKGWLQRADKARGRFRDFLKISLRNFVLDRLNRVEVRRAPVSLDELEREFPAAEASQEFDLTWMKIALAETLRRMEADCKNPTQEQPRRTYIWEMFRIRLLEPMFNDAPQVPYEDLIARFDLKSPTDASNMLLTGKRMFKAHLGRVVKEYAERDEATAVEIDELEAFLGRLSGK